MISYCSTIYILNQCIFFEFYNINGKNANNNYEKAKRGEEKMNRCKKVIMYTGVGVLATLFIVSSSIIVLYKSVKKSLEEPFEYDI